MQTSNMADENFKKLAEIFPNIVTETIDENGNVVRAINKELLEQEISTKVVDGPKERYEFTWPEKKQSIIAANAPTTNTLRPSVEDSVNFDTTKNLYIEGDNLEVLKILQETYLGKVKMIYIDPPYNTGSDFVYEDDFAEDMSEYMDMSGQFDEEGNRLFVNSESNGRFHTDWLNMIYPRLKMARNLLSDDGVIFISIDDNEQANLKKICDEVFGEVNFVAQLIWKSKSGGANDSKFFAVDHEYVLVYAKNCKNLIINLDRDAEVTTVYNQIDDKGEYSLDRLDKQSLGYVESLDFPIIGPDGRKYIVEHKNNEVKVARWRWSKKTVEERYDELVFKNGYVYTKNYKKKGSIPRSILFEDRFGRTRTGKTDFKELFEVAYFSAPKPCKLIKYILDISTDEDCIVMDFFSGSATTAHAVMQLNAEDGGSRQFIMVQLQEETDEKSEAYKAGYKNICEIGKERIRRAGAKIKEDFKDQEGIEDLDIGFRVLKVDSSNMEDVYYNPLELQQDILSQMTDNIKSDRNDLDLLFQVMLDMGIEISSKIDEFYINNKKCFSVEDDFLIACFDKDIDTDLVKEIAKKKPQYAVILNRNMINDSLLTNFDQIFKEISPDTVRKVL